MGAELEAYVENASREEWAKSNGNPDNRPESNDIIENRDNDGNSSLIEVVDDANQD